MLLTQTELESSHLESLKPAQRGAEEDCGEEGNGESERKEK